MLSHTTKRRTTRNFKTSNQNCQKIKLYGRKSDNQGVKEETFVHIGRKGGENAGQGCGLRTGWVRQWLADQVVPNLGVDKPGGTTGERERPHNPGFQYGEKKVSKPLP